MGTAYAWEVFEGSTKIVSETVLWAIGPKSSSWAETLFSAGSQGLPVFAPF